MSPRPLDPEDLRDEEPTEAPSLAFTPAESRAASIERAALVVDEVGRGPALPCSLTSPRFSRPRYGWSCDPDGPGCSRIVGRPDFPWHSPEADSARRLDAADFAVLPFPVRGPSERATFTGRRAVEPPPLRQVGVAGDLAAALVGLPNRRSRAAKAGRVGG